MLVTQLGWVLPLWAIDAWKDGKIVRWDLGIAIEVGFMPTKDTVIVMNFVVRRAVAEGKQQANSWASTCDEHSSAQSYYTPFSYPTETGFPDSGYLRKSGPEHLFLVSWKFSPTFTAHMHVLKNIFWLLRNCNKSENWLKYPLSDRVVALVSDDGKPHSLSKQPPSAA